jgi:hypothetical protein
MAQICKRMETCVGMVSSLKPIFDIVEAQVEDSDIWMAQSRRNSKA